MIVDRKILTESIVEKLARHPYWWALLSLLFVPLFKGGAEISQEEALWILIGSLVPLSMLYLWADKSKYRVQINSLFIISVAFLVKLCYILSLPVNEGQHDVFFSMDKLEKSMYSGHAGYIGYILQYWQLPNFDVRQIWQFAHPPLHHIISALWIFVNNQIFSMDKYAAWESLQHLTLFYSTCITISAYKILRHFNLKPKSLYIALIIINFHPTYIRLSGSINNDVLSIALMLGALVYALKWYDSEDNVNIILMALCTGLGIMTKMSTIMVILPISFMFIFKIIDNWQIKLNVKRIVKQYFIFLIIFLPIGFWFSILNFVRWGVPIGYIHEFGGDDIRYVGHIRFSQRLTDFSTLSFDNIYVRNKGVLSSYTDYNPTLILLKSSIFDEYIGINPLIKFYKLGAWKITTPIEHAINILFFYTNLSIVLLGLISLVNLSWHYRKNILANGALYTFMIFAILMILSIYKISYDLPFVCSANFRYITPIVIIGVLFIGLTLDNLKERKYKFANVAYKAMNFLAITFAMCSVVNILSMSFFFNL